jgi:hypothetical protein
MLFLYWSLLMFAQQEDGFLFREVTQDAGISYSGVSYGMAWGDINGDGYPDLFCTGHGLPQVYINQRNGTFSKFDLPYFKKADTINGQIIRIEHFDFHGASWGDVNNDGHPDLYLPIGGDAGSTTGKQNILFLHNGDSLVWVNRADEFGLTDSLGRGRIGVWFDQNGDGYSDVFICNLDRNDGLFKSALYLYDPSTQKYLYRPNTGLVNTSLYAATLIRDPVVDRINLLNINQLQPTAEIFNVETFPFQQLFTINQFGLRDVAVGDFNGDGLQDFFMVSNWFSSEAILKNDTTLQAFIYTKGGASGYHTENRVSFRTEGKIRVEATIYPYKNNIKEYWWIGGSGKKPQTEVFELDPNDPTNRGFFDCFLCVGPHIGVNVNNGRWEIFVNDPIDRARCSFKITSSSPITDVTTHNFNNNSIKQPDRMMIANRTGIYTTRWDFLRNFSNNTATVSVVTGDFDNDMDLDLVLSCQGSAINYDNLYYENDGNGFFTQVSGFGASGSSEGKSGTITTADFNNDGFLDLFVENGEGVLADDTSPLCFNNGPYQLFQNKGNSNHWVIFDIRDNDSPGNKLAYGTTVLVYTGGKKQIRVKGSEIHAYGQNDARLHFGLGNNKRIDSVQIIWPDKQITSLHCLKADSIYLIHSRDPLISQNLDSVVFEPFPPLCLGGIPFQLPTISANGLKGTWFPDQINTLENTSYIFKADRNCTEEFIYSPELLIGNQVKIFGPEEACQGTLLMLNASEGFRQYHWNNGDTTQTVTITADSNEIIFLQAIDSNNCVHLDTLQLLIKALPPTPVIQSNSPVLIGRTISLNTVAVPGAEYTWAGPNGFVSGLQNPEIPLAGLADAGVYSLYLSRDKCNGAAAYAVVEVRDSVGLSGKVINESGSGISSSKIIVSGADNLELETDDDGFFFLSLMEGAPYVVKAEISSDLENAKGISVADIAAIQQHIFGIRNLESPYKIISADASQTASITRNDISILTELILQNRNDLPGRRWDFVPSDYIFPDPAWPFPYPDSRIYNQMSRQNDQDFIAIRIGDVNGTYYQPAIHKDCSDTLYMFIENKQTDAQQKVSVSVRTKNFSNISGWQGTLNWNPDVLQLETLIPVSIPGIKTGYGRISEGKLSLIWYDSFANPLTLSDSSILFNLLFYVSGNLNDQSDISIDASMIDVEAIDGSLNYRCISLKKGSVRVNPFTSVQEQDFTLHRPVLVPNPFSSSSILRFELSQPSLCQISITDMAGRHLHQEVFRGSAGINTLQIGQGMSPGSYILHLETAQQKSAIKMVVVK